MSLYDKAAVAFFAKGAAGKDRVAYNAKPVEKLGKELITNGGFDTDTDWTKEDAFTISNGKAVSDGTLQSPDIYQNVGSFVGRKMQVSFTVSDYEKGTVGAVFHAISGGVSSATTAVSGNGSFSLIVDSVTDDHNGNVGIRGFAYFKGKIDNFSVKEVIEQARDFEFTRGSALTATRIGPDGLIKKGRENLLLYSNKFDETGTWGSGAAMTGGQAGYDGKNNAWKMSSGTGNYGSVVQTFSSPYPDGVLTFSAFAKAGNNDGLVIRVDPQDDSPLQIEYYADLSDGTFANNTAGPQTLPKIFNQITDVGDGWYRLQLTFEEPIDAVRLIMSNTTAPLTTNVGAGQYVYIQDAQLENSIVPTEPIETFGSAVEAGLQEREPRFNYHDYANDGYPALLMEEARTNLFPYSEGPKDKFAVTSGVTAALSQTEVGPDGRIGSTLALGNMLGAAGDRIAFIGDIQASDRGEDFTGSIYVKGTSGEKFTYQIKRNPATDGDGNAYTSASSGLEQHTFNGKWQRISATFTSASDTQKAAFYFSRTSDSTPAADEDTADEFFIYGGQIEKGTFPTSYIPTYGTVATRAADLGTLSNVNEFVKGNSYTILFDFDATENKMENTLIFSIKDPNGNNSFTLRWHSAAENVRVYNDLDKHYPTNKRVSSTNKWLLRINENKFDWFYNNAGTPTKDAASVFTPREMGTFHLNGRSAHVNQVLIFDHALPDEDCNSLIS